MKDAIKFILTAVVVGTIGWMASSKINSIVHGKSTNPHLRYAQAMAINGYEKGLNDALKYCLGKISKEEYYNAQTNFHQWLEKEIKR